MPTGITEYGDISPRVGIWAAVEMLKHAEPILVLEKFAQARPIPQDKGKTIKFRRPVPFAAATTPLTEGVTPTSQQLVYEGVEVNLAQYGAYCELTDVIDDVHEDPVLKDMSTLCAEQAAETKEVINWGILKAVTNPIYSNGGSRTAVNTPITLNTIRKATRNLKANKAKQYTQILDASTGIGTRPIESAYVAFGHTDMEADLRGLAGFTPSAAYGTRKLLCPQEIGSIEGVRIMLSPTFTGWPDAGGAKGSMFSTTGTSADVYPLLIMGTDAWGTVPLRGKEAIKPMVLNPNTPRGGDPLGQRGTVAWKTWHAALILNALWMAKIECAITAL